MKTSLSLTTLSLWSRVGSGLVVSLNARHFDLGRRAVTSHATNLLLTEEQRFMFDLEGFVVVKGVFSKDDIATANAAVDRRKEEMKERRGGLRNTKAGTSLSGDGTTGRRDLGGMLAWPAGEREVFQSVLAHPKLVPFYHTFLGEGYRLDHLPLLIAQSQGAEGFALHGGPLDSQGRPDFSLTYQAVQGEIRTSLLAAAVQLVDVHAGDGTAKS
jgi:hypothetical protein